MVWLHFSESFANLEQNKKKELLPSVASLSRIHDLFCGFSFLASLSYFGPWLVLSKQGYPMWSLLP